MILLHWTIVPSEKGLYDFNRSDNQLASSFAGAFFPRSPLSLSEEMWSSRQSPLRALVANQVTS
jgi:hypothetical protein